MLRKRPYQKAEIFLHYTVFQYFKLYKVMVFISQGQKNTDSLFGVLTKTITS